MSHPGLSVDIAESSPARDSVAQDFMRSLGVLNDWQRGVAEYLGEKAMKTIVSALIALSVLAGVAAPASALDAKTMSSERQDRASQAPVGGPSSGEPLVW